MDRLLKSLKEIRNKAKEGANRLKTWSAAIPLIPAKIKEALICLRAGRVTLAYPYEPAPPVPEGFRGKPEIDIDKCTGCGGCATVCPARTIIIQDLEGKRTIDFQLERCTFCARCQEVCPEGAVVLSPEFELATDNKEDLHIILELEMVRCESCGEYFTSSKVLQKLLAEMPEKVNLEPADLSWLKFCTNCRKSNLIAAWTTFSGI